MSRDTEPYDETLDDALALDEEIGPAPRISKRRGEALIASVLDAWRSKRMVSAEPQSEIVSLDAVNAGKMATVLKLATVVLLVGAGSHLAYRDAATSQSATHVVCDAAVACEMADER